MSKRWSLAALLGAALLGLGLLVASPAAPATPRPKGTATKRPTAPTATPTAGPTATPTTRRPSRTSPRRSPTAKTPRTTTRTTPRTTTKATRTATRTSTRTTAPTTSRTRTRTRTTTRADTRTRTTPPQACTATFTQTGTWATSWQAEIDVTNTSDAATKRWQVTWTFPGAQTISSSWGASLSTSGATVTARSLDYNGALAPSESARFGILGTGQLATAPVLTCTAS